MTALLDHKEDQTNRSFGTGSCSQSTRKKQTEKTTFFESACEKYKEHPGTAQQGRPKHLLVTDPSMRLLQGTAIFG